MKYKHLLFDADNTLFDFTKGEKESFKIMGDMYNLEFNQEVLDIYHKINSKCWKDYEKGLLSQDDLKVLRFSNLCQRLHFNIDPKDFNLTYTKLLSSQTHLMEGAKEVLNGLVEKGYMLQMVTNGICETQYGRLNVTNLNHYFKNIFISSELGCQKPDKEFFDIVLNTIDAKNCECIIIGDRLESDIKGGLNSNIDTIWLNYKKMKNETEVQPTFEINSLSELLNIL